MPKLRGSDSTALKGSYKRRKTARQRAVEVLTQSNRKGRIPAFWYENGWFRDRNRTQPWVYPNDLEQQVQWVDDLTGQPRGWSLGANLVTNGTFDTNLSGWTLSQTVGATLPAWSSGAMRVVSDGTGFSRADQSLTTISGRVYRVNFSAVYPGAGSCQVQVGDTQGAVNLLAQQGIVSSGWFTYYFVATGPTSWIRLSTGSLNATGYLIDNVTVQEVILDQSWFGPELVTNGDFSSGTTGWNLEPGWSISSGSASYSASSTTGFGNIYQLVPVVAGKVYALSVAVTNRNSFGRFAIRFQAGVYSADIVGNGIFTSYLVAPATGNIRVGVQHASGGTAGTATITIDDFSVREIPGHPSVSPSAGNGPTATARVNLLQRTEQFDNAAWVKSNSTVVATAGTAPDGTNTAWLVYPNTTGSFRGVYQGFSGTITASTVIWAKAAGKRWLHILGTNGSSASGVWFDLQSGVKGTQVAGHIGTIASAGNGWYKLTVTNPQASNGYFQLSIPDEDGSGSVTPNGTDGVLIWHPDLRLAVYDSLNLPAYQRVGDGSAGVFDYDHVGFPVRLTRGAENRGLMTLGTLDFSATDALHAGIVNVQTAAGTQMLMELGPNVNAPIIGSFYITVESASTAVLSRGSTGVATSSVSLTPPTISATRIMAEITPSAVTLFRNEISGNTSSADQGTGNYGIGRLYEGGRSLDSSPSLSFSGEWLPGFVVDGSVVDASLASEILGEISNSLRVSEVPFVPDIFTPARLFSKNEQGLWIDLNNLSTLYQDSAGTIPVTNVEQPVGLILDRSKGLVLGANTAPADLTAWTKGGASTTPTATTATFPAANVYIWAVASTQAGRTYQISIVASGSGTLTLGIYGNATGFAPSFGNITLSATPTEYTVVCYFLPTDFDRRVVIGRISNATATAVTVTSVSVRELPGNHLVQATSTKRPTLSARYNLLTYSEDLSNAVWLLQGVAVSATAGASPFGTTAYLVYPTSSGNNRCPYQVFSAVATSITTSVYAKASGKSWVLFNGGAGIGGTGVWFNVSTGTVGTATAGYSGAIQSVGSGWFRLTVTHPAQNNLVLQVNIVDADNSVAVVANGTDGVLMWGADCRLTIDTIGQPEYQRVGAATFGTSTTAGNPDYDTLGFQPYLRFDGTDDSMATAASVDFTGTDKMTVFAGVTKLSDVESAILIELSANWSTNNGTFVGAAPNSSGVGNYSAGARGDAGFTVTQVAIPSGFAAPITNVYTASHDIPGNLSTLRLDGVLRASATANKGLGNFGNYVLYIGARNNASLFLNGRIYSMIIRGASSHPQEIMQTEKWIAERSIQKIPEDYRNLTINNDYLVTAAGDYLYVDRLIQ